MQDEWTNPFGVKRDGSHWQCGHISDDESDSCPDHVIYQDDHLENLLGLYTRSGKAKQPELPNMELLEAGMESNQHNLVQACPSDRETAVWDALEASESSLLGILQVPKTAHAVCWAYDSQRCTSKEQIFQEFLEDGGTDPLQDERIPIIDFKLGTGGSREGWNEVMEDRMELKDGWDYVAQEGITFNDVGDHVVGMSSQKFKARQAKSGANKKKLNFNFGSRGNAPLIVNAQQGDEGQKLSLAQQLQNLAEAEKPCWNQQDMYKQVAPGPNLPMSERLLELAQSDLKIKFGKKHGGSEGDSINHVIERENDVTSALTSTHEVSKRESINDQLQRALLAAAPLVSMNNSNRLGKIQGPVFGFTAQLQKVLDHEKIDRADFLKLLQTNEYKGAMSFMDVQILSKSLEARLAACVCNIQKLPEAQGMKLPKVMVIFNMQANAHLELDPGTIVRLYPPWAAQGLHERHLFTRCWLFLRQEIDDGEFGKTLLCTYFCEVLKKS